MQTQTDQSNHQGAGQPTMHQSPLLGGYKATYLTLSLENTCLITLNGVLGNDLHRNVKIEIFDLLFRELI